MIAKSWRGRILHIAFKINTKIATTKPCSNVLDKVSPDFRRCNIVPHSQLLFFVNKMMLLGRI